MTRRTTGAVWCSIAVVGASSGHSYAERLEVRQSRKSRKRLASVPVKVKSIKAKAGKTYTIKLKLSKRALAAANGGLRRGRYVTLTLRVRSKNRAELSAAVVRSAQLRR